MKEANNVNSQKKEAIVGDNSIDSNHPQHIVTTQKEANVKKNYLFNLLFQLFLIAVPLVTTPYLSRVLTSEGVGQYSFSFSIITYFTLFGSLGFGFYAQREIAKHKNDKHQQSVVFWEINICRLVPVSIALITNITLCFLNVYGNYNSLMLIFNVNIVSIAFDIAFLYQGKEEFGKLVLRNFIVKVLSVVCIFVFVKTTSDLWKYAVINSISVLISNLIMWVMLRGFVEKISLCELRPFKHFKGTIVLFLPTIAVSVYTILDKTLIGLLVEGNTVVTLNDGTEKIIKVSDIQNGYYEQSEKMVKLVLTILTSLGTVMIPKNSYYYEIGDIEKFKSNITKALKFVMFLGTPLMFGLMAIATNFSPWFFGSGYDDVPYIIMIFSPLIMAIGFSNVFGIQYMVPSGKDWLFTFSIIFGAIVNLSLNLFLIRLYGAIGAAVASVIAEVSVVVFQALSVRKEFSIKNLFGVFLKYIIFGAIMFVCVFLISYFLLPPSIVNTLILIAIGAAIYGALLIISKDEFLLSFFDRIFKKRRQKV